MIYQWSMPRVSLQRSQIGMIYLAEGNVLKDTDARLIKYLQNIITGVHLHTHHYSFISTAPIFVARQLVKHQVGLVWNEISRRYVDSEPEFYVPKVWRKDHQTVSNKGQMKRIRSHMVSKVQ